MHTTVRLTTDKSELHAFLQRDPIWAAYAIGDLEPAHFDWCTWRVAEDAAGRLAGLALLYRRLDPPVLLTVGETAAVAAILEQMALPEQLYISAREEHLPLLLARYDFSADRVRPMLRMAVTAETFRAVAITEPSARLRRLNSADVPAIQALIALGGPFAPDAFTPSQVDEGVFVGLSVLPRTDSPVSEGVFVGLSVLPRTDSPGSAASPLLAVAGTHLVAPSWSVAAVGNVYVHPAQRGRGYGALVSSAVTAELLQRGLLVVLNVDQNNPAAINLYRQLGFAVHCPFVEGIGRRVGW
ncbi:MAG: GNAT family N-acetyltransferase [Anaerolineae bacterium]